VAVVTRDFALGAQTKVQPAVCPIAIIYPERSLGSGAQGLDDAVMIDQYRVTTRVIHVAHKAIS
jgi:hypothetical protein